jgi:hypothetical protein
MIKKIAKEAKQALTDKDGYLLPVEKKEMFHPCRNSQSEEVVTPEVVAENVEGQGVSKEVTSLVLNEAIIINTSKEINLKFKHQKS